MKHNAQYRKIHSQDNIKIRLNKKIKKIYSKSNSKSSIKSFINKAKSETKDKVYTKGMKTLSNFIGIIGINTEKESEDRDKNNNSKIYNEILSFHKKGTDKIIKKNTLKNSAALDLINKIIKVKTESFFKNSSRNYSNKYSSYQNDSNSSGKNLKLISFSNNYSFSKIDKKQHNNISPNYKHDSNTDENQSKNSKISNKLKPKISKKSLNETKNIDKNILPTNTIKKNKEFEKLPKPEKKNNNNENKSQNKEYKKHTKNIYFKLPEKSKRNSKKSPSFSSFDHGEYKKSSILSDQAKILLRSTIIHCGLSSLISDNKNYQKTFIGNSNFKNNNKINNNKNEINFTKFSSKQKEASSSILGLNINKLKEEIYEYENTDITDAINKLPTMKFYNNMKKKKTKKIKKLNKSLKINKERCRILQRKKYVYDSLDDEEYEDIGENNFYFEPDSIFINIIDFIIFLTSFVELFYYPIYLAKSFFNFGFSIKDILFYFIDLVFIIDVIIGFFKAYYNFDEYLIKKNFLIIKNYVQNWFLFDFICCIPFYTILKIFTKKAILNNCYEICYFDYNGGNLYYLLVLIKVIKIIKVISYNIFYKQIKNELKKNNFFHDWGNVLKYLFLLISVLHIGSSVFIFVARNSYPNWILDSDLNKNNFIQIYICSIHHLITTMTTIGYGDVVAKSTTEKIFEITSLIVGTCLYSWIITSASNYIKKKNEKYIKFEKNKEILNEIKLSYPLMSDCLYDKIYRLIYYGKSHVETDKGIILESLPDSIRNELLIQMYEPIIINYKLFQYFENSEFIIRIVSLLKPIVCSKGDVLVNEGDYIEDIIINKSGILSLDVCIDLNKQKESIEEYLTKYNLGEIKNTISINQDHKKSKVISSNTSISFTPLKLTQISNNKLPINDERFIYKKSKNSKNLKFIKIIYIRRNEYFGEVLMFLNEKSPLYIRVHSKKVELFLLRKTEVLNLSSDYPNIWDKMNKKSIFNLEQIKNIIVRKLSNYCNLYGIKTKLLHIKKYQKNSLYSFTNYLMPIPDFIKEEITSSRDDQFSDFTKSQNTDDASSEFKYNYNQENNNNSNIDNNNDNKNNNRNNNNNIFLIKEDPVEDINVNTNFKMNKSSFKNINQNKKDNININNKYISNFSKKYKKIEYSSSPKDKTNTIESTNSIITMISNNNHFPSFINKKNLNPLSHPFMDKLINECTISMYMKKIGKKTKSSNCVIKNEFKNSLHVKHPYSFNNNKSYENITNLKFELNYINDEIYPNEKFEIILKEEDDELMSKNIKNTCQNLFLKLLEYDNQKKQNKTNNIFNNLKIDSSLNIEIKSSYDNLNLFTNSRYIIDNNLREKTKKFLGVQCGFISQLFPSSNKLNKSLNKRRGSISPKNSIKIFKRRKSLDSPFRFSRKNQSSSPYHKNDIVNLSYHQNENLFTKKSKNFDIIESSRSFCKEKNINKSVINLKQLSPIKSKNYSKRSFKKNYVFNISDDSPKKKNTRKSVVLSDVFVKQKTLQKMNLISENMQRDKRNLNNPNEFYANMFNNFVVNNRQTNKSRTPKNQ